MQATAGPPSFGARAFAWSGALLFVASLTYFLFAYLFTFGEIAAGGGATGATAVNVALFTAFALHHSVFARERVRAWVARVLPPRLERAAYVWIASLMLIAVCAWWQPVPGVAWRVTGAWRWPLFALQALGVWLSVRSAAMIDVLDLAGVRQLEPQTRGFEFKTSGPYGWIRHPIYAGWFLLVLAAPAMTMTRFVFAVTSCIYVLIAIPFEERSLRRSAGSSYERYIRDVRWRLIPRLY